MTLIGVTFYMRVDHRIWAIDLNVEQTVPADAILVEMSRGGLENEDAARPSVSHHIAHKHPCRLPSESHSCLYTVTRTLGALSCSR